MNYRKGRVFALATLAAGVCAVLSAGSAVAQCKAHRQPTNAMSTQNVVVSVVSSVQQTPALTAKQIAKLTQRHLQARIQLQQRQLLVLERVQLAPRQQAVVQRAVQKVQDQNDLMTAALQQLQEKAAAKSFSLQAVSY